MKQRKISIRITPKKQRKEWQINPVQRLHSDTEYKRDASKHELRREIEEQFEDE